MGMEKMGWIFLALFLILLIWAIWRREMCKSKIRHMGREEKQKLLSDLTAGEMHGREKKDMKRYLIIWLLILI